MTLSAAALRGLLAMLGIAAALFSWKTLIDVAGGLREQVRLLTIEIRPDDTGPVVLGRAELVQPPRGPTAERHVAIERQGGAIVAYDIAPDRRVGYAGVGAGYTDTDQVAIPEGTSTLRIGGIAWKAERRNTTLELRGGPGDNSRVRFTKGRVRHQRGTVVQSVHVSWHDYAGSLLRGLSLSYRLGGDVADARLRTALESLQIPDSRLPANAARLRYGSNGWVLVRGRLPVAVETDRGTIDGEARAIPLVDATGRRLVRTLTIGRTEYEVTTSAPDGPLRLTPIDRVAWIGAEDVVQPPSDAPIRRRDAPPQKRLDPDSLNTAALIALACAAFIFVFAILAKLKGARAVGLASAGLALAAMPEGAPPVLLARAIGVGLAGMGAFAIVFARFQPARRKASLLFILVLGAGIAIGASLVPPLDAGVSLRTRETALAGTWLAIAAPLVAPALTPAAALFWSLLVACSTFAAAAGVQLAMLEPTEQWNQLLDRHLVALAAIGLVGALILGIAHEGGSPIVQRALLPLRRNKSLKWAGLVAGIAFVLVTFVGDEVGFFGLFQPSEIAKSLLVLLVAVTLLRDLARRKMLTAADGALDLGPPILAVGLASAILTASALNYDMSPILVGSVAMLASLVAGTALHTMQLRQRPVARRLQGLPVAQSPRHAAGLSAELFWPVARRWIRLRSSFWPVALLSFVCLALAAVAFWIVRHPSFREGGTIGADRWLITPWKRTQSWFDMSLTNGTGLIDLPETGLQLRLAREALAEARCSVLQRLCPADAPVSQPPGAEALMLRVPAVQDDFAAVSLVHAFGMDGALLYASAQAGLVAAALAIGLTALFSRRDFRLGAWLAGCAAIGMAALVAAQIALAWGNVLGFFPVMGQPMTFVSFGASHHLGVALPFAALTLVAATVAGPGPRAQSDLCVDLHRHRVTQ